MAIAQNIMGVVPLFILAGAVPAQFAGFGPPDAVAEFEEATAAAFADIDLDGDEDLLIGRRESGPDFIDFYRNDGFGNFTLAMTQQLATEFPATIAVGDIDNDGDPDAIIAGRSADVISIVRSTGSAIAEATSLPINAAAEEVALADFNNDGQLDIAAISSGNPSATVYFNDGGGTSFTSSTFSPLPAFGLDVADFDNDGDMDIVAAGFGTGPGGSELVILPSSGDGTFGFTTILPETMAAFDVVAGDFNRDGAADIAVALFDGAVSILLSDGASPFPSFTRTAIATGGRVVRIAAADVDRDGDLDLAASIEINSRVVLLINDGGGGFTPLPPIFTPASPQLAVFDDPDRDGDLDLALPTLDATGVLIYPNLERMGPGCREDLSGDGVVDVFDLAQLIGAWGACP